MMKKIFLSLMICIFLINIVNAISVCIDKTPPSAPSNLVVSGKVGNITLTWDAATDVPDCSGIESYTIKRNNPNGSTTTLKIVDNETLTFIDADSLSEGVYSYIVYATDKVGHNGKSIKKEVVISKENGGVRRVVGGRRETSYICEEMWECSSWSACINGRQTRTCEDLNNCGTELLKPAESRACAVEGKETEEESDLGILKTQTEEPQSFFSKITGAVIGGGAGFYVPLMFIVIVLLATIIVYIKSVKSVIK